MARKKNTKEPRNTSTGENDGYVEVGKGDIIKWSKGKVVEGIYEGTKDGSKKFKREDGSIRQLLNIRVDGILQTYAYPAGLEMVVSKLKKGTAIKVHCIGKKKIPGRPQPAWDFIVYQKAVRNEN